jgi:hypothetical protein
MFEIPRFDGYMHVCKKERLGMMIEVEESRLHLPECRSVSWHRIELPGCPTQADIILAGFKSSGHRSRPNRVSWQCVQGADQHVD